MRNWSRRFLSANLWATHPPQCAKPPPRGRPRGQPPKPAERRCLTPGTPATDGHRPDRASLVESPRPRRIPQRGLSGWPTSLTYRRRASAGRFEALSPQPSPQIHEGNAPYNFDNSTQTENHLRNMGYIDWLAV